MRYHVRSRRSRSGHGLVEYSLTLALLAVGLTLSLLGLRDSVGTTYSSISSDIDQASACSYRASCDPGIGGGSGGSGENGEGNQDGNGNGNAGGGNGNGNNGNGNGNGGGNGSNGGGNGNGNNGNGNGGGKKK